MDNNFNVLLVDDTKENLFALSHVLVRDEITIYQALSGDEALEIMLKHDIGLALLDIQMPGMNGLELAELMRGSKRTKDIPIIFVTALSKDESYVFRGYESGAVDFIRKPIDPHAVKSKVNVFLQLHVQKKELEKQVEELKLTRLELERSVRVRDEFMAIAGHELKTPLTSFKLQTQMRKRMLSKKDMTAFTPENLNKMFDADNTQLERLTRLIDDMLDISRMSSGKLSMDPEYFDLGTLLKDLVDRNLKGNKIEMKLSDSIVGHWDKCRIEQVFNNLLSNAIRYGEDKPIDICLSIKNEFASIIIKDQGVGISEENIKRIFQKYERASETELHGLGLGLYIVSQILEAHHGSISVKSHVGKGSEFTILLPYDADYAQALEKVH